MQRRTKIICTLGPATQTREEIAALIVAGMNIARINFSHGTQEEHAQTIQNVRNAARDARKTIAVLQDLQGPKIRVGKLNDGQVELVPGRKLIITTEDLIGTSEKISTTYEHFASDVKAGQMILLDDGLMKLHVESIKGKEVITTVIDGGTLHEHKGINLPATVLSTPCLTNKDIDDLQFGIEQGVDLIALSFVRSPKDIEGLRQKVAALGASTPLIAKIEKPEAMSCIDEIIRVSDGIMVARGDLGVEIPPQDVPMIQKLIIRKCNDAGVPVITATQMLESMVHNPRPTRAEASDVANAVLDGTDAVMLSEETSVGEHPVEAVQMMSDVCAQAEKPHLHERQLWNAGETHPMPAERAIAHSACVLAERLHAQAILSLTHSGTTARLISRERPSVPVIGVTTTEAIARRMCLYWGVESMLIDEFRDTDSALETMRKAAIEQGFVRSGDTAILSGGHPLTEKARTNFIKVAIV
jgi:pyruvate kinase